MRTSNEVKCLLPENTQLTVGLNLVKCEKCYKYFINTVPYVVLGITHFKAQNCTEILKEIVVSIILWCPVFLSSHSI